MISVGNSTLAGIALVVEREREYYYYLGTRITLNNT